MGKRPDKIVTAGKYVHIDYRVQDPKPYKVIEVNGRDYTLQHDTEDTIEVNLDDHYLEVCMDENGKNVK